MTSQQGAWFSLGVALAVLALKAGAYGLSGSVALLSDAAESLVNVAAALVLMISLRIARTPPDYQHPYGHHKAEYLSTLSRVPLSWWRRWPSCSRQWRALSHPNHSRLRDSL